MQFNITNDTWSCLFNLDYFAFILWLIVFYSFYHTALFILLFI